MEAQRIVKAQAIVRGQLALVLQQSLGSPLRCSFLSSSQPSFVTTVLVQAICPGLAASVRASRMCRRHGLLLH